MQGDEYNGAWRARRNAVKRERRSEIQLATRQGESRVRLRNKKARTTSWWLNVSKKVRTKGCTTTRWLDALRNLELTKEA